MKSDTWELGQIFENRRQYRVPFYQRTYTWVADRQWDRLWDDIEAKAEATSQDGQVTPHFLGAIVVEPQRRVAPGQSVVLYAGDEVVGGGVVRR